jgi:hypothetical protein
MNPEIKTNEYPQLISYLTLRKAVGILGLSFPVVLAAGALITGDCHEILDSISTYYHTGMRNIFVGVMCALALFLFAYRGYDWRDAVAGNLGCLFALGVAFFPTSVTGQLPDCIPAPADHPVISSLHFISAAMLFLVLTCFSLCLFTKGSGNPTPRKLKRNRLYRTCGYTMLGCLVLIAIYFYLLEKIFPALSHLNPVFWLESFALWAFGISWLTKGKALLNDLETNDKQLKI